MLSAVLCAPILLVAVFARVVPSAPFRWANVFRLYLSLLFGVVGLYGHLIHPRSVVELIPAVLPFRTLAAYASGVLELAFAVLIWTRFARVTGWAIMVYLALVLPFNIYGWTIASNTPSYANAPLYLWVRVPLQGLFMAFAWFGACAPRARGAP